MKWLTFDIQRSPGFRLNLIDIGFILFLCGLAVMAYQWLPGSSMFWLPLYLGLSFFLFCNVFRIGNRMEIFWYIPFILVAGYSVFTMNMNHFWLLTLFVLEPVKWALIGFTIKKSSYHGAGFHYKNSR